MIAGLLDRRPEIDGAVVGSGFGDEVALDRQPLPPRYAFFIAVAQTLVGRVALPQELADALRPPDQFGNSGDGQHGRRCRRLPGTRLADTSPGRASSAIPLQEFITRLNAELKSILALPETKAAFETQGMIPAHSTPEQFRALMVKDAQRWATVIKAQNITAG